LYFTTVRNSVLFTLKYLTLILHSVLSDGCLHSEVTPCFIARFSLAPIYSQVSARVAFWGRVRILYQVYLRSEHSLESDMRLFFYSLHNLLYLETTASSYNHLYQ